jgi:hypothetical protein
MPMTPGRFGVGSLTPCVVQLSRASVRHPTYSERVERRCICKVRPGSFIDTDPT